MGCRCGCIDAKTCVGELDVDVERSWDRGGMTGEHQGRRAGDLRTAVTRLASLDCRVVGHRLVERELRTRSGWLRRTVEIEVASDGGASVGRGEWAGFAAEERAWWSSDGALAWLDGLVGRGTLAERAAHLDHAPTPAVRAASEAALLSLALAQSDVTFADVCGGAASTFRFVLSSSLGAPPRWEWFDQGGAGVGRKVDVDPRWSDEDWSRLADRSELCVLDAKARGGRGRRGTVLGSERAAWWARRRPDVWVEDPDDGAIEPLLSEGGRIAFDAELRTERDLERLPRGGAGIGVNLKPARVGGPLFLLELAADALVRGSTPYVGGSFELGAGRSQLQVLASVIAPGAPNDAAPSASFTESWSLPSGGRGQPPGSF